MSNLINKAINRATAINANVNKNLPSVENTINQGKLEELQRGKDAVKNIPVIDDPILLARQKKAELLEKKARVQEEVNLAKEVQLRERIDTFTNMISIPSIPTIKIPTLDKKALGKAIVARARKELERVKQKITTENLEKGVELYSYPIKDMYESAATRAGVEINMANSNKPTTLTNIPPVPSLLRR